MNSAAVIDPSAATSMRDSSAAESQRAAKIAFVTNFCPHYRVKTFELLAERFDADFYFYSDGGEWYWQKQHGTQRGQFSHEYLAGFRVLGTRITPTLFSKLRGKHYQAIIKCIDGRFALAASYLIARLRRLPFILWTGVWSDIDTPFHRLTAPLIQHIYQKAAAIVVYGEHVRRYLRHHGVDEKKIVVAAHAVDNEVYSRHVPEGEIRALREKLQLAPTDRAILYLGRLEESKGLPYLFEAFRRVSSNAVLVVAGDGGERSALAVLAKDYGLSNRIRFAGYVSPNETLSYYAMAYVFVLPSIATKWGKEPWGLVVNEAMNQGVPVIATEIVGAAAGGLVRDGINGFVVPERDPVALAMAISTILESQRLRDEMSANAKQIISKWNNARMVRGFEQAIAFAMHKGDSLLTSP